MEDLPSAYNVADSPINDLTLTACDQISTVFRYQINNEPEVIVEEFTIQLNDDILGFGSNNPINGLYASAFFEAYNLGTDDFEFGFFSVELNSPTTELDCNLFFCPTSTIDIIEYGGIGNPVIVNIEGTSNEGDNYTVYVNGILE